METSTSHWEHIRGHTVQPGFSLVTKETVYPPSFTLSVQLDTNAVTVPELRLTAVAREALRGKSKDILE